TLACSEKEQNTVERPREVWLFRSVLDEQPRMVTAALHDELWVAYDARDASLYKIWKGGVNFNGAVYTTVHGPQPTSMGYAYYEKGDSQSKWIIEKDGQQYAPEVAYKGHSVLGNNAAIRYELILKDGTRISVTENPEYIRRGRQNGLSRVFEVSGAPEDVKIGYPVKITSLMNEEDFKVNGGQFQKGEVSKVEYTDGSVTEVEGIMYLNPEAKTELRVFYHPGFDDFTPDKIADQEETTTPRGATLINQSDCRSCHNEKLKTVGPSYLSVARKYPDSEATVKKLAGKVINGGNGIWGAAVMTAHPDLAEEDAYEMIRYILTLDDDDDGGVYAKYTLGQKAVALQVQEDFLPDNGSGLASHLYLLGDGGVKDAVANDEPVKSGVATSLHALDLTDFPEPREGIAMEFVGSITIPKDGSYDFRLISDDESYLFIKEREIIDNGGYHGPRPIDGEVYLQAGTHPIRVLYSNAGGGAALSLQWFDKKSEEFVLVTGDVLSHKVGDFKKTAPYIPVAELTKAIPGDAQPLTAVHPSFDIFQARPDDFKPRVGGIDFFSDGRMVICTWDSLGPVYTIENYMTDNPADIKVTRIAEGLAEPLGIKVVDDEIYVLQKQELTKLVDIDGDGLTDEYETVSDKWRVSANFHEFAFGLVYEDGYFYATLATAIMPGGASASPQIPDRGKVVKISKEDGSVEFVAKGLRTPNGIGIGTDGEMFVADNQGDWLPASKIVHIQEGAFYGSRSVDPVKSLEWEEKLPVVWLPQDEIGNSPSEPARLDVGPYKGQMIHGEVTHGGLKRVFTEKVDSDYQGAVFRFTQGLESGVNRIDWTPDGKSIIIGGVGSTGNWGHAGKLWFGLQRLTYNNKPVFDMQEVRARSNGFEIEFTEPIKEGQYITAEDFKIQQWFYKPTEDYGGPKLDLEDMPVKNFYLSDDRKKVFLELPDIKENHVVYFRIVRPFVSESDLSLWTTEAWYTLNKIPQNKSGFISDYKVASNTLTEKEKAEGWKLLFDGKSTEGIRNYGKQTLGSKWSAKSGTLHFAGSGAGEGGDIIITDKPYDDYELYLEWKISKGGNSGIIYNVTESEEYDYPWMTGPEMQILDNSRHPDGKIFMHRAGDLYDMIPTRYVTVNDVGEWNRVRIVSKDGKVQHWQNGHLVVEYTTGNEEWKELIAKSKFKDWKGFGDASGGHISLQDHGDPVWFRNIKIKAL
ncbi:MAG: family 16 glycoside hydrolase, partial [Cyclobacteriaceae bacterium]